MIASTSTADLLKARMGLVRKDLDEVVGRLTQDMISWAPGPGVRTVGGQLFEIAGTEVQIQAWLTEERKVSFEELKGEFGDIDSLENLKAALTQVRKDTLAYLDSLSPEDLDQPIDMPKGWFESLGLASVPRAEVFRSLAQHEWYHVGQLVSYLWARGDDPYTW